MNPEANNSAHTPRRRSGSLPSQNAAAVQPRGSFVFRDEMGILHPSLHITPNTASAAPTLFQPTPRVGSNDPATNRRIKENESEAVRTLSMKAEDYDSGTAALEVQAPSPPAKKKTRKKWSLEETTMLVEGCRKHGVGNWKAMLDDESLTFDDDRTPVDLKDRFRTYFPDSYRKLYPNAKTHLSSTARHRTELPDTLALFEKNRSKKRRPFTPEEDAALREGFERHGTVWALIGKHPSLASRRSTDLRDRFRNAFPDLYEKAGYKPRPVRPMKKVRRTIQPTTSAAVEEPTTPVASNIELNSDFPFPQVSVTLEEDESQDNIIDIPRTPQMEALSHVDGSADPLTVVDDSNCDVDGMQILDISSHGGESLHGNPTSPLFPSDHSPWINASSTSSSSIPSRQRSPSGTRAQSANEYFANTNSFINNNGWYPARWLSGAQSGPDDMNPPHLPNSSFSNQNWSSLGGLGFGSWSNQQNVFDRYDLPAPSFAHEFASEAAVGDTGSSISGATDGLASLPMSSHHPSAGDLFHGSGRGAGYYQGQTFSHAPGQGVAGFMMGGGNVLERMPSFARVGFDLQRQNLPASAQSPDISAGLRQDLVLESIDEMEAIRLEDNNTSPIGGNGSVEPSQTMLYPQASNQQQLSAEDLIATPPPSTPAPNSPPLRSFSSLSVYGSRSEQVGQGHHYPQSGNGSGSHSRSFSQPPSEHRAHLALRQSNTTYSSPVRAPFQPLDGSTYSGFDPQHQLAYNPHPSHSHSLQHTPTHVPSNLQPLHPMYSSSSSAPHAYHHEHLSTMALDLQGYHVAGQPSASSHSGMGGGYNNIMDQYLNFETHATHALDLAGPVPSQPPPLMGPNLFRPSASFSGASGYSNGTFGSGGGGSMLGLGNMEESVAPYGRGVRRKEMMQPMSPPHNIPLNRVHSAGSPLAVDNGSMGGTTTPSRNWENTGRKRSSWGPARTFG